MADTHHRVYLPYIPHRETTTPVGSSLDSHSRPIAAQRCMPQAYGGWKARDATDRPSVAIQYMRHDMACLLLASDLGQRIQDRAPILWRENRKTAHPVAEMPQSAVEGSMDLKSSGSAFSVAQSQLDGQESQERRSTAMRASSVDTPKSQLAGRDQAVTLLTFEQGDAILRRHAQRGEASTEHERLGRDVAAATGAEKADESVAALGAGAGSRTQALEHDSVIASVESGATPSEQEALPAMFSGLHVQEQGSAASSAGGTDEGCAEGHARVMNASVREGPQVHEESHVAEPEQMRVDTDRSSSDAMAVSDTDTSHRDKVGSSDDDDRDKVGSSDDDDRDKVGSSDDDDRDKVGSSDDVDRDKVGSSDDDDRDKVGSSDDFDGGARHADGTAAQGQSSDSRHSGKGRAGLSVTSAHSPYLIMTVREFLKAFAVLDETKWHQTFQDLVGPKALSMKLELFAAQNKLDEVDKYIQMGASVALQDQVFFNTRACMYTYAHVHKCCSCDTLGDCCCQRSITGSLGLVAQYNHTMTFHFTTSWR
jgi:hypothetical protein